MFPNLIWQQDDLWVRWGLLPIPVRNCSWFCKSRHYFGGAGALRKLTRSPMSVAFRVGQGMPNSSARSIMRGQIRHLIALKNGRRNPVFAALTKHRWCMVPQNTGKLPGCEWKITLWSQFRTHAATLPAYRMALYASALKHTPTPLCIAGYLACLGRGLGSAHVYVRGQIVHLITGELGPLS